MDDFDKRVAGILRDCGEQGWDSYGADPVTPRQVELARRILPSIPDEEKGSIGPTTDGGFEWEWDGPDGTTYMVTVWTSEPSKVDSE